MSYRELVTSVDALGLVQVDPTLSPVYGVDVIEQTAPDITTPIQQMVSGNSVDGVIGITDTSSDSRTSVIEIIIRPSEVDMSLTQKTDVEVLTQDTGMDICGAVEDMESTTLKRKREQTSRSGRVLKKSYRVQIAVVKRTDDTPSLMEAMTGSHRFTRWQPATEKEFKMLEDMGTFTQVAFEDIPNDAEMYPTKMVYTINSDIITGAYVSATAQLVVVGNALKMTFQNVFAPTSNDKSLKLFFVLAVTLEMHVN
jgi:hypothetical protein